MIAMDLVFVLIRIVTNFPGRIQYSREFLLNLQYEPDSLKTPKGLTIFPEIILNGASILMICWFI